MARRLHLTDPAITHLMRWEQEGVVARRQLEAHGARPCDVERLLRRKELHPVHRGVFVDHNGPLTRRQREWAAVLALWPAALCDVTALPDPSPTVVHVMVDHERRVSAPDGVVLHRCTDYEGRVEHHRKPPVLRLEEALIDVTTRQVSDDDVAAAFATLARTAFTRRTTPALVLAALERRRRVPGRATIEGLLRDLRDGACSVLERGYLHRVERAHGLPCGARQSRSDATGRPTDQDVRYAAHGLIVELDGRAYHDSPRGRTRDAARDLAELAHGNEPTVRVTWAMVFGGQCRTAALIAEVLRRRGWTGIIRRCHACPPER